MALIPAGQDTLVPQARTSASWGGGRSGNGHGGRTLPMPAGRWPGAVPAKVSWPFQVRYVTGWLFLTSRGGRRGYALPVYRWCVLAADGRGPGGACPSLWWRGRARSTSGGIRPGSKRRQSFVLTNRGDAPLVINHVRKSCGCATAELAVKSLAPGATAELTTAILGNHVTGSYRKNFYVESNDPAAPLVTLTLAGDAVPLLIVKPQATVNAGCQLTGRAWSQTFVLETTEPGVELGAPRVNGVPSPLAGVRPDGEAKFVVTFTVTPEQAGEWRYLIQIPVNKPANSPALDLTITGKTALEQ